MSEFLKQEVADEAIRNLVTLRVVPQVGVAYVRPANAPATLAEVQWRVMVQDEQNKITRWLADTIWGMPRIDWIISIVYVLAPLLQQWCLTFVPQHEYDKWWLTAGAVIQPIAMVAWVQISMYVPPHILMAAVTFMRIPLLCVPLVF